MLHTSPTASTRPWLLAVLVGFCLCLAGCAASTTTTGSQHIITVEGQVSSRGNEPFAAQMLETDDRNLYVLNLDGAPQTSFIYGRRYRIEGRLYLDDWNSFPYAHLQVLEVTEIDTP